MNKYGGETITDHFKEFGHLTSYLRKKLVHTLINFFLENKFILKKDDLEEIGNMIVTDFPNEDPNFYYKPPQQGSNPTGALYYRYNNQLLPMRKHKLFVYKNNMKKTTFKDSTNSKSKFL